MKYPALNKPNRTVQWVPNYPSGICNMYTKRKNAMFRFQFQINQDNYFSPYQSSQMYTFSLLNLRFETLDMEILSRVTSHFTIFKYPLPSLLLLSILIIGYIKI